ncbi:peptidase S8/S53 domain-containing protein, partial [Mycena alexandri]
PQVAAGNQKALAHTRSPASASTVITVGTLDRSDTPQQDSNHGSSVSVFAPGTHILSCGVSSTTATATKSGSSMAAAFVSGIVATVISL